MAGWKLHPQETKGAKQWLTMNAGLEHRTMSNNIALKEHRTFADNCIPEDCCLIRILNSRSHFKMHSFFIMYSTSVRLCACIQFHFRFCLFDYILITCLCLSVLVFITFYCSQSVAYWLTVHSWFMTLKNMNSQAKIIVHTFFSSKLSLYNFNLNIIYP